ncbi:sensor histidine kinase [Chamaesiphon sp.]|uniref:sensor histidine kinase n=1 Tax=Chamaesiphon sp. TaxID=2814140 RepID=UPI00359366AD
MKPWQSVSARLTLTLLTMTLGSLVGLSWVLDSALKQFFVRDAQASLERQSSALAAQLSQQQASSLVRQLSELTSQQQKVQVIVFDSTANARVTSRGIGDSSAIELPPHSISKTLSGAAQTGQFWIATDAEYPWWLYSTAPIGTENRVIGAVYVAMPLRRPRQFAEQVKGMVMGMMSAASAIAIAVGVLVSRTVTHPLQKLHRQTQRLEAGDYNARSRLRGNDELAQLSHLLNQMADKLLQTLTALQAQETARRELVANVSHDLRTPLTILRVGIEAILDGVVTGDKAQIYLQRACSETDRLSQLVEQLLFLSKADAGQLELQLQVVSPVAIAQECLSRMQPSASKAGLELKLYAEPTIPTVEVDPALTGQVILNLLDNAIKYAADGKIVCLNVLSPVEQHQRKYVPLQIQDYGQGMASEMIARVTDRFYRGDNSRPRGGMGLGLAIAHQVCQLQHGSLQIESEIDRGTMITLFLPIATGVQAETMPQLPLPAKDVSIHIP